MFTVDANIWVNAFDLRESGHSVSRLFLDTLRVQPVPVIVPNLLLIEVAGAISRTRRSPAQAQAFATALSRLPHATIQILDDALGAEALVLAAQYGLRGADAVYAAVARAAGSTLVSLDNEDLERLGAVMAVCTPSTALASLAQPPGPST